MKNVQVATFRYDIVVDKDDGVLCLFDKVDNLHVGIEDLAIVEDALYWG